LLRHRAVTFNGPKAVETNTFIAPPPV
jgi:hypothetical protein